MCPWFCSPLEPPWLCLNEFVEGRRQTVHPAWKRPQDVLVRVARSFALTRFRPRPFRGASERLAQPAAPPVVFPLAAQRHLVCFHLLVSYFVCCLRYFPHSCSLASRDLRGCSSSEVSCLLPRRYHNHWRTSPASVSSTSRVGSRRMVFITRFPLVCVGWNGCRQPRKTLRPDPYSPPHGFFWLPLHRMRGY